MREYISKGYCVGLGFTVECIAHPSHKAGRPKVERKEDSDGWRR